MSRSILKLFMDIDPSLYNQCLMQYQQHQQTLALSMAPTTTISRSRILSSSAAPSTDGLAGTSIANTNNNNGNSAAVEEGGIPSELLLSYLQTVASMNPSLLLLLSNSNLNTNADSSSSASTPFLPPQPPEPSQQTQVLPPTSSSALESPNPQVSFPSPSSAPQTDQQQSQHQSY